MCINLLIFHACIGANMSFSIHIYLLLVEAEWGAYLCAFVGETKKKKITSYSK